MTENRRLFQNNINRMKKTKENKPVSKLKRTINIITTVLSCMFLALLLVCLVSVFVSKFKGEQPNLFGYSFLYILTDSMEPELPVNSSIMVKECNAEDVKAFMCAKALMTFIKQRKL